VLQLNHLGKHLSKIEVKAQVEDWIKKHHLQIDSFDFDRPWGGYFVLSTESQPLFIKEFFFDIEAELLTQMESGLLLNTKFLVVAPGARLSWQYHDRRSEEWRVVSEDSVLVARSLTDAVVDPQEYPYTSRISLAKGERHRLIGGSDWGIVAEIWRHLDPAKPSEESDIVRLQDDYNRQRS
jgi:mannose-6-phosphate isomerase